MNSSEWINPGAPVTASDLEEIRLELLRTFFECGTTRRRQVAEKSVAMASTGVNEQFLDDANVIAAFEELSGETVPKCVGGSMFRDSRRPDGFLYDFLNDRLIDVVAALQACFSVEIPATRGKHELPSPLGIRVGILASDRVWQFRAPGAFVQRLILR